MNATKLTRQAHIDAVPSRWQKEYASYYGGNKQAITNQLLALTPPLTAKTIIKIIGNESWTSFKCDICNKERKTLYYFKPHYYDVYENSGLNICKKCLP